MQLYAAMQSDEEGATLLGIYTSREPAIARLKQERVTVQAEYDEEVAMLQAIDPTYTPLPHSMDYRLRFHYYVDLWHADQPSQYLINPVPVYPKKSVAFHARLAAKETNQS